MFTCKDVDKGVLGKRYEPLLVGLFAIKLSLNSLIEDFAISSNDQDFGNLDDVVVEVTYKSGEKRHLALQLKHKTGEGDIKLQSFLLKKGDFSIQKYFSEIKKVKKDLKNFDFAIFTNGIFAREEPEEDCTVEEIEAHDLFNTNDQTKIFKFHFDDSSEEYKNFLRRFYVYTCQQNVEQVENNIKEFFAQFGCPDRSYKAYLEFLTNWNNLPSKFRLDKETIRVKIGECLLEPFCALNIGEENSLGLFFQKIFPYFQVTITDKSISYCKEFIERRRYISDWTTKLRYYCLQEQEEISDLMLIKLLWQKNEIPLIVNAVPEISTRYFQRALEFCNQRKFIVIGNFSRTDFDGFKVWEDYSDLASLDGEELRRFKVSFHGRGYCNIEQLSPEMKKIFRVSDLIQVASSDYIIGERIEEPTDFYIERFLPKIVIDFKFLEYLTNTLIILACTGQQVEKFQEKYFGTADVISLEQLLSWSKIEDQRSFVVLTDNCSLEDFEKLQKNYPKHNIHQLSMVEDNLEWIATRGSIRNLQRFSKNDKYQNLPDHETLNHFHGKVNVICADPGMGKTVMMKFLLKNCPLTLWPLKINLTEHYQFFQQERDQEEILEYFFNSPLYNLTDSIVRIFREEKKIFFLWDGIDELPEICINFVVIGICKLANEGYIQWVAGRRHLQNKLEQKFGVFALNLTKFNEEQQRNYIHKRLNHCDEVKLTKILETVRTFRNHDLLGIPLQIYMLTEIFQENVIERTLKLTDIYELFFRKKFRFFVGKTDPDLRNYLEVIEYEDQENYRMENYKKMALRCCFNRKILELLGVEDLDNFLQEIHTNADIIGIVTKISEGGRPIFAHLTYAEFLSALYLKENWKESHEALRNLLFQHRYTFKNIIYMFDMLMSNDCRAHLAVLYKDIKMLKESDCNSTDLSGRNALHLACGYGEKYLKLFSSYGGKPIIDFETKNYELPKSTDEVYRTIIQHLVQSCDVTKKDNLTELSVVEYSMEFRNFLVLEELLALENHEEIVKYCVNSMREKDYGSFCTLICICIQLNFYRLFSLIDDVPPINVKENNNTLLHLAVKSHCSRSIVEKLLKDKHSRFINEENKGQLYTPLHFAVENDDVGLIQVLIENGALVDTPQRNVTPLQVATKNGSIDTMKFLIKMGAKVNTTNRNGENCLNFACRNPKFNIIRFLLVEQRVAVNTTCLQNAVKSGDVEVVQFLIKFGAMCDAADKTGMTPLHSACRTGNVKMLSILKDKVKINARTKKQETALHLAAVNGKTEIVNAIDFDFTPKTSEGYTALHLCCRNGHLDFAKILLLKSPGIIDFVSNSNETALSLAVNKGYEDIVRLLLRSGAKPNLADKDSNTPLHLAASRKGYVSIVRELLSAKCEIDAFNISGRTPLFYACKNGNFNTVRILIETGANVNIGDAKGNTPLFFAIKHKQIPVTKYLMNCIQLDVNKVDKEGMNALHHLISFMNFANSWDLPELIKPVLERGICVNHINNDGDVPLHYAINGTLNNTAKLLLEFGADINIEVPPSTFSTEISSEVLTFALNLGIEITLFDKYGSSMLQYSIKNNLFVLSERLISSNDIKKVDKSGRTALHTATEFGCLEIVKQLIYKCSDLVNVKDCDGRLAIHFAARNGHADVTDFLLKKGSEINHQNIFKEAPLHEAVSHQHWKVVAILISNRCLVCIENVKGHTPLHVSLIFKNVEITKTLLENGACVNCLDKKGYSPLYFAMYTPNFVHYFKAYEGIVWKRNEKEEENMELAKILLNSGCEINTKTFLGVSPLHFAVYKCSSHFVKFFLDRGAEINATDENGRTPLAKAIYAEREETVRLLLKRGVNSSIADNHGNLPLHVAVTRSSHAIVKLLIDYQPEQVYAMNNSGSTPLHLCASECTNREILKILIQKGGDLVNFQDNDGNTPLHGILHNYQPQTNVVKMFKELNREAPRFDDHVVRSLVENGGSVSIKNKEGETPIDAAEKVLKTMDDEEKNNQNFSILFERLTK